MQTLQPPADPEEHLAAHRRPEVLDMVAGGLLILTVVLHVVAMFPSYYSTGGGLTGSSDQAAEYALLAAAWALALAFGLAGPHRTPVAAGLAVGTALTEFGFRLYDVGLVFRYGEGRAGAGVWLMASAWAVGAAGAVCAALAAHRRHGLRPTRVSEAALPSVPEVDWSAPLSAPTSSAQAAPSPQAAPSTQAEPSAQLDPPAEPPSGFEPPSRFEPPSGFESPSGFAPPTMAEPASVGDQTSAMGRPDPTRHEFTSVYPTVDPDPAGDDRHERLAWMALVAILAVVTAGAFLPPWDRYTVTSPVNGQSRSTNLGNAFSGPWQQVIGTLLVGVALVVVPVIAIRMRNKAAAAGAVCGALLVLSGQLLSAVVSVDESYGANVTLRLTGWFTVDALAAYALFAAVMVWSTLRREGGGAHANSGGGPVNAPADRSSAMPFWS